MSKQSHNRDIGIMQGRLVPASMETLQLFPVHSWKQEIDEMLRLNVRCIELLWDRNNKIVEAKTLSNVLMQQNRTITSCCLDAIIHDYRKVPSETKIVEAITNSLDFLRSQRNFCFVVPLFGAVSDITIGRLQRMIEQLKTVPFYNQLIERNIKIAFECHHDSNELKSLLGGQSGDVFCYCLDVGNVFFDVDQPEVYVEEVLDVTGHVHIKDKDAFGQNVHLGTGIVPFDILKDLLTRYQGPFVLETAYFVDPIEEAEANLKFIREVLNTR